MGQTTVILDAFVERLQGVFARELAVNLFPEDPQRYRLNHTTGAILVAFGRSRFSESEAVDAVVQQRNLVIPLTLVFRQLNGTHGVLGYLDRIRNCLVGWKPPHCDIPCIAQEEHFIGQVSGLWQYGQQFATRATQIQSMVPERGPLLTQINFEEHP